MDFYSYQAAEDGTYHVLKNGEYFLTCCGSEAEAQNIVRVLQEDADRCQKSTTKN